MTQLGPQAKDVQVVFITVDPARDTPAALKTYMTSRVFPKNMVGLTGTPTCTITGSDLACTGSITLAAGGSLLSRHFFYRCRHI